MCSEHFWACWEGGHTDMVLPQFWSQKGLCSNSAFLSSIILGIPGFPWASSVQWVEGTDPFP